MISILITIATFLLILISVFLIFIILIQRASSNAGLGTAFGGGLTESAFGAQTGNILTRITIICSVAFFVISFGLYLAHLYLQGDAEGEGERLPDFKVESVEGPVLGEDIVSGAREMPSDGISQPAPEKIEGAESVFGTSSKDVEEDANVFEETGKSRAPD